MYQKNKSGKGLNFSIHLTICSIKIKRDRPTINKYKNKNFGKEWFNLFNNFMRTRFMKLTVLHSVYQIFIQALQINDLCRNESENI